MSAMKTYKDLLVWQKSIDVCLRVYRVSEKFPSSERYNLISQIRRSAVSMPSNIAEGYARRSKKEFYQFVRMAFSSGAELETQLYIAYRLNYLSSQVYSSSLEALVEVMKMLNGLLVSLKK